MVEVAVGQWTAEAFVKEKEQQRDLNAFGGELVGIRVMVSDVLKNGPCTTT
jgi:hypothetical protein